MKYLADAGGLLTPALRVLAGNDESHYALIYDDRSTDAEVLSRYVAVPSLADPRALLALNASPPAWRTALEQHARGAASRRVRTIARLLKFASYLGLGATLFRGRIALVASDSQSKPPLHSLLGEILGRYDFVTNLRIAPGRPNSKPVVQVVSPNGEVLAYAKFGWDPLTQKLIKNEAKTLGELAPRVSGSVLHIPKVLYSGGWNRLEALVLAPLDTEGTTPWRAADMPIAASVLLAGTRPALTSALSGSAFWKRVCDEVERSVPVMSEETGKTLLAARVALDERWGNFELSFGQSHGDWIPPNISIGEDGTYSIWDWERGEADVPLGLDTLQFILFVELHKHPDTSEFVHRVEMHGRQALQRQGLRPELVQLLAPLSLLRSFLWFAEAKRSGRSEPEDSRFKLALGRFLTEGRNSAAYSLGATEGIPQSK